MEVTLRFSSALRQPVALLKVTALQQHSATAQAAAFRGANESQVTQDWQTHSVKRHVLELSSSWQCCLPIAARCPLHPAAQELYVDHDRACLCSLSGVHTRDKLAKPARPAQTSLPQSCLGWSLR